MPRHKTNFACTVDGCASKAVSRGWCKAHYTRWRRNGDVTAKKTAGTGEPMAFLQWASQQSTDACCMWPFAKSTRTGYGILNDAKTTTPAHRKQCVLVHGAPPLKQHQAAHSCGNRLCVNPRHLRWATPVENAADQLTHGTRMRGERQGSAKLTREQVHEIRRLKSEGNSGGAIARSMGLSRSHVNRLAKAESWSWL